MYKSKRILALIPARGGSKGIKNKNIIDICGKPLISYTINAAKESKYIDYVFVSTDSEEIKEVALKCGANVPFLRDESLAKDTSKTIDAVVYSINKLKEINEMFDYLVLLQPTSPLRKSKEIDEAIEKICASNYDSLASVSLVEENPILFRTIDENGKLISLLNENSTVRRQDFKKYYRVNGAIYINEIKSIDSNVSLNDNKLAYIMEQSKSIDIDSYEDVEKVLHIMRDNNS